MSWRCYRNETSKNYRSVSHEPIQRMWWRKKTLESRRLGNFGFPEFIHENAPWLLITDYEWQKNRDERSLEEKECTLEPCSCIKFIFFKSTMKNETQKGVSSSSIIWVNSKAFVCMLIAYLASSSCLMLGIDVSTSFWESSVWECFRRYQHSDACQIILIWSFLHCLSPPKSENAKRQVVIINVAQDNFSATVETLHW